MFSLRRLRHAAALGLTLVAGLFVGPFAAAQDAPATPAPAATPAETAKPAEEKPAAAADTAKPADGAAPKATAKAPAKAAKPKKPRRGGVHPCMTPDPGFGNYDKWSRAPSMGQMIMPKSGGLRKDGTFDVVIHFHGHEAIRKEFVKTANGVVLVGIDLGIGSGAYSAGFASPDKFTNLIASIEKAMADKTGNKNAKIRKLALSSWSAGYGAIEQILRQTGGKNVDAIILLDSLHTGYENHNTHSLKIPLIEPFIQYAKKAAAGKTFMFMSHSSIIPPGYASTTEVSDYVVKQLGGKPTKQKREDVLGLDMYEKFDKSGFHMRGYDGDDKPDHCAHLGLIANIMKVHLQPRWKTPVGKGTSPKQQVAVKTPPTKKTGSATDKPAPAKAAEAPKPAAAPKKPEKAPDPAKKPEKKSEKKADKKKTASATDKKKTK